MSPTNLTLFADPLCAAAFVGPALMFHKTIVMGGKGPATFWEKEWGSIDSFKYDTVILNNIKTFLATNPDKNFIWMQDNAPAYRL